MEVGGVYIAYWSRGMTVANKHPFRGIANCAPEIANHFCHFPFSEMTLCLFGHFLFVCGAVPLSELLPELSGHFSVAP